MRCVTRGRRTAAMLVGAAAATTVVGTGAARAELVFGTTLQGFLVSWDSAAPQTILNGVAVQGLQSNEQIVGLDFRPATGELFGLGSFSRLYRLDTGTGQATQVGSGPFAPPLNGSAFGFDVNPVTDQVRVVTNENQSLTLSPVSAVVNLESPVGFGFGDGGFGVDPNVVHLAFNNSVPGASSTTLFGIDTGRDVLAIATDAGALTTIGPLGVDVGELGGFDISSGTGTAFATLLETNRSRSTFVTINLQTGTLTPVGEVGGGAIITAMAVVPSPGSLALLGAGSLLVLRRRRS